VAGFVGHGVLLQGTLLDAQTARTPQGEIRSERRYDWPAGSRIEVLMRPDDIEPDADSPLRGRIVREAFKGAEILYTLRLQDGTEVLSLFPSHNRHQMGEEVGLSLTADHLVAFRCDQGT
jgi:iron(III) transport system ATP-binding protein